MNNLKLNILSIILIIFYSTNAQVPVVSLPERNNYDLDKKYNCDTCPKNRFGMTCAFKNENLVGIWIKEKHKWIWHIDIQCNSAEGLMVKFSEIEDSSFACIKVYNDFDTSYIDVIYNKEWVSNIFYTQKLSISYTSDSIRELPFKLLQYVYVFNKEGKQRKNETDKTNTSCDYYGVNCLPGQTEFCNQIRSVVRFYAVSCLPDGGAWFCSGVLINNCHNNFEPYILTAAHCVDDPDDCQNTYFQFTFNYQLRQCVNQLYSKPEVSFMTQEGADLIKYSYGTFGPDMALLKLKRKPPVGYNVYYAGWDALEEGELGVTCIHHPKGRTKKLATGIAGDLSWPFHQYWETNFGNSCLEHGSSGSPLFRNDTKKVIGICSFDMPNWAAIMANIVLFPWIYVPTGDAFGQLYHFIDEIREDLGCAENINSINGIDPILSCQPNINVHGRMYPGWDWQEKNEIIIQANHQITNSVDISFNQTNPNVGIQINNCDYTFRAGNSIKLTNGFKVDYGHHFLAQNGPCQPEVGCGFNYQPLRFIPENENSNNNLWDGNTDSIKITPNPVEHDYFDLHFNFRTKQNITIRIYDIDGKNLYNFSQEQISFETIRINLGEKVRSAFIVNVESKGKNLCTFKMLKM